MQTDASKLVCVILEAHNGVSVLVLSSYDDVVSPYIDTKERIMEPARHKQHRGYIDTHTGEQVDLVVQVVRRGQAAGGGWLKTMQDALTRIVRDDVTDGDRTIFIELLARADWENYILINVSELALEIGRSRQTVSGALSRLVDHGYLLRGPRVGRSSTYRLSPDVGWKGTDQGHADLQRKMRERGMSVVEGTAEGDR